MSQAGSQSDLKAVLGSRTCGVPSPRVSLPTFPQRLPETSFLPYLQSFSLRVQSEDLLLLTHRGDAL